MSQVFTIAMGVAGTNDVRPEAFGYSFRTAAGARAWVQAYCDRIAQEEGYEAEAVVWAPVRGSRPGGYAEVASLFDGEAILVLTATELLD